MKYLTYCIFEVKLYEYCHVLSNIIINVASFPKQKHTHTYSSPSLTRDIIYVCTDELKIVPTAREIPREIYYYNLYMIILCIISVPLRQ